MQIVKASVDALLRIERYRTTNRKKRKIRSRTGRAALWFYRLVYLKVKAENGVRGAPWRVHFTLDTVLSFCYVLEL